MMLELFTYLSHGLSPFFLLYFGTINIIYTLLLLLGSIKTYRRWKELSIESTARSDLLLSSLPEISFILPCYNESHNIVGVIDNLLNISYRPKEIIIVNDGSTDDTFLLMQNKLHLLPIAQHCPEILPSQFIRGVYRSKTHPEIAVVDKENGGKFDALNAALNLCKSPYCITIDADTRLDDAGFKALIRPVLTSSDTIAIGASVRIGNGCVLDANTISTDKFPEGYVTAMQSIEYLRTFLSRQGWDYLGGNYVLSGAFSIFVTDVLVRAKGFAPTVADDLEIILRLNRLLKATDTPYRTAYLPDPVAWTEGPRTIKALGRQRMLWHRGTLESVWFNKTMLFNPRYGAFGLFVFPFLVFGDALEPLVEILGYLYIIAALSLGVVSPSYFFLFLAVTIGFTFIFTIFSLLIEELSFRKYPTFKSLFLLFAYSAIENFGYRQLTLWWRVRGFLSFFKKFSTIRKDARKLNFSVDQVLNEGRFKW